MCAIREETPLEAIARVPAGAWAVAVSGGADSVALLRLLGARCDVRLIVVHLDHQTREGQSTIDARFVGELAGQLGLKCVQAARDTMETKLLASAATKLPGNLSARYRFSRFALFREVVESNHLDGVVLAHHADDQAETVLQRLLRGSSATGLTGMAFDSRSLGVRVLRPLLKVPANSLRDYLNHLGQRWCEDVSNRDAKYLRNRIRLILKSAPSLRDSLLELADACAAVRNWQREAGPTLPATFAVAQLADYPAVLARAMGRDWLLARGSPINDLSRSTCDRLIEMARDRATPARQHFPGGLLVIRRRGQIYCAEPSIERS